MFQTDLGKRSIRKRYAVTSIMGLLLVFVYMCVSASMQMCVWERERVCVCICMHSCVVSACVYSWWLCASRTAFIRININMCLSRSPSHPCPLVPSVQGRPLSSRCDCRWTWRKVRQARWLACRGQTVRLIQLKPPAVWRILHEMRLDDLHLFVLQFHVKWIRA